MKSYDFSKPGGFPFTQDILSRMQQSLTEVIGGLAQVGGDGPFTITGGIYAAPTGLGATWVYGLNIGWLYWNGRIIETWAHSEIINPAFEAAFIKVDRTTTDLVFNDGSSQGVVCDEIGKLWIQPIGDPVDPDTMIPFSDVRVYGRDPAWTQIPVAHVTAGDINGDIYYKRSALINTSYIRGALTVDDSALLSGMASPTYYTMGALPVGWRPLNKVTFMARVVPTPGVAMPTNPAGSDFIRHINGFVDTDGSIKLEWIAAVAGATSKYSVEFSAPVFMD